VTAPAGAAPRLDHGAIGNGRVLALVAPDTRIEWLCMPRFDSPSVFAALLDPARGGAFGFEPVGDPVQTHMEYVSNTNVLCTRVTSSSGSFDLYDYAHRILEGLAVRAPLEIHRLLLPREGSPLVRVRFDPRPEYAQAETRVVQAGGALEVLGGATPLYLATNAAAPYVQNGQPFRLDRPRYFILSWGRPSDIGSITSALEARELTVRGWRAWAKTCALPSFASSAVLRSASVSAPHLRGHGRDHRSRHDEPSGGARHGPDL
jgi:GH15 family glucan-1,4-alpha-glucosidase